MKTYEGALPDSGELVFNVTKDAREELMLEHTTVLGVLKAYFQALQVRPPGVMTPHLSEGASKARQMLHAHTTDTLVLLEGTVLAKAVGDVRGRGLNLAALPREALY